MQGCALWEVDEVFLWLVLFVTFKKFLLIRLELPSDLSCELIQKSLERVFCLMSFVQTLLQPFLNNKSWWSPNTWNFHKTRRIPSSTSAAFTCTPRSSYFSFFIFLIFEHKFSWKGAKRKEPRVESMNLNDKARALLRWFSRTCFN